MSKRHRNDHNEKYTTILILWGLVIGTKSAKLFDNDNHLDKTSSIFVLTTINNVDVKVKNIILIWVERIYFILANVKEQNMVRLQKHYSPEITTNIDAIQFELKDDKHNLR